MTIPLRGPLGDDPLTGRRLLNRALIVVHFSSILTINERSGAGIASFQEAIRRTYPKLNMEVETNLRFEIKPDAPPAPSISETPIWRMYDIDDGWRVSLTSQSVSIEAQDKYTNRFDFAERMKHLVELVERVFAPSQFLRIGVRYANTADVENGPDPRKACAPDLVSISGLPELQRADLLWTFGVDEGTLILRSGLLRSGTSYDPVMVNPVSSRSWYLDIDVVSEVVGAFDCAHISSSIAAQARRAHAIYCWAMPGEPTQAEGSK